MSKSTNLLLFLIILKMLLASTQKDNSTFLITGGYRPTQHALVKHTVSLQYKKLDEDIKYSGSWHFCGGAMINPRYILTAAHCFFENGIKRNETTFQIVAKTPNRLKTTQHTEVLDIKEVILYPDYDNVTLANDIAILHLISKINEDNDGPIAADALYADIYILEKFLCQHMYKTKFRTVSELCAGILEDPEQGVCQGDSGGPLICDGKVVGVVSYGYGYIGPKRKRAGVFTDVWYYRDWIHKVAKLA